MESGAANLNPEPEPEPEPESEAEAQPQPEPEPKAASGGGAAAPPSRTEEPSSAAREGRAQAEGAPQASSADGKQKQPELDDAGSWGRGIDCPKIWCARLLSLVWATAVISVSVSATARAGRHSQLEELVSAGFSTQRSLVRPLPSLLPPPGDPYRNTVC